MCDPTGCVAIAITIFASFMVAAIFATYAENTHVVPKKSPKEEKLYTISEAEEKIYQEISKKYTSFERKDISINNESGILHIENSYLVTDVQTRYNISHIYTKTINDSGKKITHRSPYDLSSEWLGHNIYYEFSVMKGSPSEQAKHVDLNPAFTDNDFQTQAGTIFFLLLGWI
jgi:hypothetical protein